MPHPEVAVHPIHGPDGSTVLPVGHPMHRAGDEVLPDTWGREFVDEMVAGGYAVVPPEPTIVETSVVMTRPERLTR